MDEWQGGAGNVHAGVAAVLAVAAHAGVTAVEDGGIAKVRGISAPIEVGLIAGVATLLTESLLVSVDVVAVP